jgi:hypothetical protein
LVAAAWVAGYATVNATAGVKGTPELWWETRQGELTVATGHAVLPHSWSWTAGATSWIPNSWGWGVLLAGAYHAAGLAGIVAFVILVQVAFLALAWRVFALLGAASAGSRIAPLIALSLSMSGWASGRSELSDYFCIFGFALVRLLPRVRAMTQGARTAVLGGCALLLACLWENLHLGGFVAVAVFASIFLVCETAAPGRTEDAAAVRLASRVAVIIFGSSLGMLLTPAGPSGIGKSLVTAAKSREEGYAAWLQLFAQPSAYNYEPALLSLATGGAALALAIIARRRVVATLVAVAALATCVVVRSGSDLVMLSVISGTAIASRSGRLLMPARLVLFARHLRGRAAAARRWAAVGAGIWAVGGCVVAAASVTPLWGLTGVDPGDLASIPSGTRVYSSIAASDAIALLRPDLQVTIDSRNDLYPVGLFMFARSLRGTAAGRAPEWFARHDVRAVYLPGAPSRLGEQPLPEALRRAAWRERPERHGLLLQRG